MGRRQKPLSGAARARRKLQIRRAAGIADGELIFPPDVSEIDVETLIGCRREMAKAYLDARAGRLLPEDLSRFVFALKAAADVAVIIEQRQEIAALRAQLAALAPTGTFLASPDDDETNSEDSTSITHNPEN